MFNLEVDLFQMDNANGGYRPKKLSELGLEFVFTLLGKSDFSVKLRRNLEAELYEESLINESEFCE
jgi:hypothetical protein